MNFLYSFPNKYPKTQKIHTIKNITNLKLKLKKTTPNLQKTQINHKYSQFYLSLKK